MRASLQMPHRIFQHLALPALTLLATAGCSTDQAKMLPAGIKGFNHTSANINSFSVDQAGGPNVGPYGGGTSESCCGLLPSKWYPGMKALVEWEKDPNVGASAHWPEREYSDAWNARMKEHRSKYTQHRAYADIPQYGEEVCAIQVHFLPCDQVRISTTCYAPWHPDYPDKEYFNTKEPKVCPAT